MERRLEVRTRAMRQRAGRRMLLRMLRADAARLARCCRVLTLPSELAHTRPLQRRPPGRSQSQRDSHVRAHGGWVAATACTGSGLERGARRPDGRAARQAAAPARGLAGAAARRAHDRARRLGHRGAADAGRPALAHRRQRLARAPVGRQAQQARSPALPPAGRPRSRGALGSIWRRGGGAVAAARRALGSPALPVTGGTHGNDIEERRGERRFCSCALGLG
jgi:hypothetical protein